MSVDIKEKIGLFEAVLFLTNEPLPLDFFCKAGELDKKEAKHILDIIENDRQERDSGILLMKVAGGYHFATNSKYSPILKTFFESARKERLRKSSLEVLSIIAYKQPIHIAAIDEIRGSASRQHIGSLMSMRLIKPLKRLEMPGRPIAYGTTHEFLKYFGLNSLKDLPQLSEIKEINFDKL
jgi:segregation and condensation protein B